MKKILSILLIIMCLLSIFMLNVNAEEDITKEEFFDSLKSSNFSITALIKTPVSDENGEYIYYYNHPEGNKIVTVYFIGTNATTANNGYFYLITYSYTQMKWYSDGKIKQGSQNAFYYVKATTKEEMEEIVFGEETASANLTSATSTYAYQAVLETDGLGITNPETFTTTEGDPSIKTVSMTEYYNSNIKTQSPEVEEENNDGWFSKIWDSIKSIPTLISDGFNDVIGWLESLLLSIQAIPDVIAEFFKTTITNEMGEEITITEYIIDDIDENLEKRLFFNTVKEFGTKFKTFFNKDFSQPPDLSMLTLNFANTDKKVTFEGKEYTTQVNWGNEKKAIINLEWYARYKPFVDTVLSCFLWMGFMFMLWRNLTSIIQGNGAGVSSAFTGVVNFNDAIEGKTTTTTSMTHDNDTGEILKSTTTKTTRKKG